MSQHFAWQISLYKQVSFLRCEPKPKRLALIRKKAQKNKIFCENTKIFCRTYSAFPFILYLRIRIQIRNPIHGRKWIRIRIHIFQIGRIQIGKKRTIWNMPGTQNIRGKILTYLAQKFTSHISYWILYRPFITNRYF